MTEKTGKGCLHKVIERFLGYAVFALLLSAPTMFSSPSEAGEPPKAPVPLWWPDKLKKAEAAGYALITLQELQALIGSGQKYTLLDVRPDYEYRDGHLPAARNLEFNLGHRWKIEPARADAMKALLGGDLDQAVVIYCRNFR